MKPGEEGSTTDEVIGSAPVLDGGEAPVVAAAAPVDPAPVITPPAAETTTTTTTRTVDQVEAELATSLVTMESLRDQMGALQGTTQAVQQQREEILRQLTGEIAKRGDLEATLETLNGKLTEASQATQTLLTEKTKVEEKAQFAEQKAASAEARAVRLETIVSEFPALAGYASFITASEDPAVVRAACEEFQKVRNGDLDRYRQTIGGLASMATVPTGNPARVADPATPDDLADYLAGAYHDPVEFERRISSARANYETRKGS